MARVRLYRYPKTGVICLQFSNGNGDSARHSLPVTLTAKQWDGSRVTQAHPQRASIDVYLQGVLNAAQKELLDIQMSEPTRATRACVLRDRVVAALFHENAPCEATFTQALTDYTETHQNGRTREIYAITGKRVREYDARVLAFRDITAQWLDGFVDYLKKTEGVNARAIHLRNIRACFNWAIRHDLTEYYPFRKYTIKTEDTEPDDLSLAELQTLFAYTPPTERTNSRATKPLDWACKYIDTARLIFYLRGINVVDLCALTPSDYRNGRIKYKRAKTGTLYNIKVEPEAAELLAKYKGDARLWSPSQTYTNYKDFAKRLNDALKRVSVGLGLPPVTTYTLRYTYASFAYAIGLDINTVSDLLGHQYGQRVTLGYVNKKRIVSTIDDAARLVLDYIKTSAPSHDDAPAQNT